MGNLETAEGLWLHLAAALGIGMMVGLERERRKDAGPRRIAAGIRTFSITALLGAVAMLLGGNGLVVASALAVGCLATVAYWQSDVKDYGVTTGVSLLLTLLLGALAMQDAALSGALGVVLTVLLARRSALHNFVRRVITEGEMDDALVLAAATLVILPLLPNQYLGPFEAFNPRTTWTVVILMMGVGAAGHVAQRLLGVNAGLLTTGFVAGLVSSTATIAAMGERAQREPEFFLPAVAGAVMSTVASVTMLVLLLAVTSPSTLAGMATPLLCSTIVAMAYAGVCILRMIKATQVPPQMTSGHAFSLPKTLGLAGLVSVVMVFSTALQAWFGSTGVSVAAAFTGLADTHAASVSVASLVVTNKLSAAQAVVPILIAISANTLVKCVVALASGGVRFGLRVVPGLLMIMLAAWLAWALTS